MRSWRRRAPGLWLHPAGPGHRQAPARGPSALRHHHDRGQAEPPGAGAAHCPGPEALAVGGGAVCGLSPSGLRLFLRQIRDPGDAGGRAPDGGGAGAVQYRSIQRRRLQHDEPVPLPGRGGPEGLSTNRPFPALLQWHGSAPGGDGGGTPSRGGRGLWRRRPHGGPCEMSCL